MEKADRIKNIPPYIFFEIDKIKANAMKEGIDIINLGIGDPDIPTPGHIVKKLNESAKDPKNHQYPSYEGMIEFREAVGYWYKNRFGVSLDPEKEVIGLIGSKEGIAHIPLAFINPGDVGLFPDPGYPVYKVSIIFAGGVPYPVPLKKENNFLPDLNIIDEDIAKKAKLMFINYPNNPTAEIADIKFFEKVVEFAKENNIVVCHDNAYSEIYFDGYKPVSFLNANGAKDIGIEFHSFSKTYNMTGWRVGFAVGNAEIIKGLSDIKTNIDSGIFQAIQYAGIEAIYGPQDETNKMRKVYEERRNIVVDGLNGLGWNLKRPSATFYVWAPIPKNYSSSTEFAKDLLQKTGVLVVPGIGYGQYGEGYFRISITIEEERLKEALNRFKKAELGHERYSH